MTNSGVKVLVSELEDFYSLSFRALLGLGRKPFYLKDAVDHMDYAGPGSLLIIVLVSLFIGMALSLQLSAELSIVGLKMYTGRVVGISVTREIGPVLSALVFAGRVGSGVASELGSMILGHQVDTLRAFGVDPVKKLVTPRVVAALIMLPALTIIGDAVSLFGGYVITVLVSQGSGSYYWSSIVDILNFENVLAGMIKPFMFAYIIACISCYMGLATSGGAIGLRRSTTKAVVLSFIMIIIADFALTKILLLILGASW
jgi:phospholipid/cholesterol/gamma-HCH transport system permease protein